MILGDLKELEQESIQRRIPIIGAEKGKWLLEQVQKIKPSTILELGTANGYSGIILASEGAKLTTIEQDETIAKEAWVNFVTFHLEPQLIIGDGSVIINSFPDEHFDIVFIDFAKKKYFTVLEEAIRIVKKNGYIIADNITMEGCQDFKKAIETDERLQTEIITIKDGLSKSKKV